MDSQRLKPLQDRRFSSVTPTGVHQQPGRTPYGKLHFIGCRPSRLRLSVRDGQPVFTNRSIKSTVGRNAPESRQHREQCRTQQKLGLLPAEENTNFRLSPSLRGEVAHTVILTRRARTAAPSAQTAPETAITAVKNRLNARRELLPET